MKRVIRLIYLGLTLSLILAACAPQLRTTEATTEKPEVSPISPERTETKPSSTPTQVPESSLPQQPEEEQVPKEEENYQIITLLPPDAIPSIDEPQFLTAQEADAEYEPHEEVLGVVFDGEARAYSVPLLSSHEIVNDTVAGRKIAVTW